jgi:hypothetical protein
MSYTNARRTAELCFIACLINVTAMACVEGAAREQVLELSKQAMIELAEGADAKQRRTIDNHHRNMLNLTIATMQDGCAGEKIVLAVYCFIEMLCDAGYITIGNESTVALLMEWLLSKIDAESELTEKRLKNAKKDANKWLVKLKENGYYS